jgi:predicted RNA-binding protein
MNGTVKVYKFRMYDIASEQFKISARMATHACIKRINARPIKGTELEIDREEVDSDGMTTIGFEALVPV